MRLPRFLKTSSGSISKARYVFWGIIPLFLYGVISFREYLDTYAAWRNLIPNYSILIALTLLSYLFFLLVPRSAAPASNSTRFLFTGLTLILAILYIIKYIYLLDAVPFALVGESLNAPHGAQMIWDKISTGSIPYIRGYGVGMCYLYFPVFLICGESILATKLLYLFWWTVAISALVWVIHKQLHEEASACLLTMIATLSYGVSIERRYKWHIIAALVVTALFVIESRFRQHRGRSYFIWLACILGLGIFGYHGILIFVLFTMLLTIFWRRYDGADSRWPRISRLLLIYAISAAILIGSLYVLDRAFLTVKLSSIWDFYKNHREHFIDTQFHNFSSPFLIFFGKYIGISGGLLLILGLGAALRDLHISWIARFASIGFIFISATMLPFHPMDNLDEANYIIVFVFLLMGYGLWALLQRIPFPFLRVAILIPVIVYSTQTEWIIYETFSKFHTTFNVDPTHGGSQGVIALHDAAFTETPDTSIVFFPSETLLERGGGFGAQVHTDALMMREFSVWRNKLLFFNNLGELQNLVLKHQVENTASDYRLIAYVNHNHDKEFYAKELPLLTFSIEEPGYHEKEWGRPMRVFKLVFERKGI